MIRSKMALAGTKPLCATIVCLGFLGLPVPAAAQDSPFAGFYVGANAGVTWSDTSADSTLKTVGTAPTPAPGPSQPIVLPPSDLTAINRTTHFDPKHHTGFTGGLEAGYNYVMDGGLLLGIETDINIYDITGNKTRSVQSPITTPSVPPVTYTYTSSQSIDTDFLWTLRPRIGYAMDKILIFASGGLALTSTKYKVSLADSRTTQTVEFARDSKTKTGWTIGGGGAYAITPQLSLKGEYLYQNFGDTDFHATSANGYLAYDAVAHLKSHLFRAGLDYRF
jgi:outer membrane immunogenic protein